MARVGDLGDVLAMAEVVSRAGCYVPPFSEPLAELDSMAVIAEFEVDPARPHLDLLSQLCETAERITRQRGVAVPGDVIARFERLVSHMTAVHIACRGCRSPCTAQGRTRRNSSAQGSPASGT